MLEMIFVFVFGMLTGIGAIVAVFWMKVEFEYSYGRIGYFVSKFLPEHYGQRLTETLYHCNKNWFNAILNLFGIITTIQLSSGEYRGRGHFIYTWTFGHLNPRKNVNKFREQMTKNQERFENHAKECFGMEWEKHSRICEVFVPGHNLLDCFCETELWTDEE